MTVEGVFFGIKWQKILGRHTVYREQMTDISPLAFKTV